MARNFMQEWLNANLSRAYPLDDSTGGAENTLPAELLVDAIFLVENSSVVDAYISSISLSATGWTMSARLILRRDNGEEYEEYLDSFVFVPHSTPMFGRVPFSAVGATTAVTGALIVGEATAVSDWAVNTELREDEGRLSPAVLKDISSLCITGIRVGDTLLTGDIELVAGDGVEVSAETTDNGGIIKITNTLYEPPADNIVITTDDELLETAVSLFGTPIRTINGVYPDANGNISIVTPVQEDDGIHYVSASNSGGVGVLQLELAKDPCVHETEISTLSENAAELNERAAELDLGVKELDSSVSSLAAQLTRLS